MRPSSLHKGDINADQMATEMGMSRQTLYRCLKSEETSYGTVLDELRHKLALQYLKGQKTSINEIAYLLGFSETAAFSRAFKKWTGISPSIWRENFK